MRARLVTVVLALTLGVVVQASYQLIFVPRPGRDVTVFDPGPCVLPEHTLSVAPLPRGDAILLFYTCQHPETQIVTVRVREFGVGQLWIAPTPPAPTPTSCTHIPGFVPTKDGNGCVPPGHPLAQ